MTRWSDRIGVTLFKLPSVRRRWASRFRAPPLEETPWTPLPAALTRCRLALLTTGGIHLIGDPPFNMHDPEGDPSWRRIPIDTPFAALTITHDYYDHADADRDPNLVLPLDPLRTALHEGWIGAAAPYAYSLMGHIQGRHIPTLRERTAPELAERLRAEGAQAALLVPA